MNNNDELIEDIIYKFDDYSDICDAEMIKCVANSIYHILNNVILNNATVSDIKIQKGLYIMCSKTELVMENIQVISYFLISAEYTQRIINRCRKCVDDTYNTVVKYIKAFRIRSNNEIDIITTIISGVCTQYLLNVGLKPRIDFKDVDLEKPCTSNEVNHIKEYRSKTNNNYKQFTKIILNGNAISNTVHIEEELNYIYNYYSNLFKNNAELIKVYNLFFKNKAIKAFCLWLNYDRSLLILKDGTVCRINTEKIHSEIDIIITNKDEVKELISKQIENTVFNLFEINLDNIEEKYKRRDFSSRFIRNIDHEDYTGENSYLDEIGLTLLSL